MDIREDFRRDDVTARGMVLIRKIASAGAGSAEYQQLLEELEDLLLEYQFTMMDFGEHLSAGMQHKASAQ